MSECLWCAFDGHVSLVSSKNWHAPFFVKALWTVFTGRAFAIQQVSVMTSCDSGASTAQIASRCLPVVCVLTLVIVNVLLNKVLVALCLVPFGNADVVS